MDPIFRRILVATDFGSSSDRALETAAALATRFSADLTVLHVIEEVAYAYPFPMPKDVRPRARARVDEVIDGLRSRVVRATGVLREGIAWYEIISAAEELGADLVVVGSQGRHGLPRFVMGSVAERVVRTSPVPVLTIHPYDDVGILAGGMDRFRHVLAPTDLSDDSRRGVEAAASLAAELEAALTLVHVFVPPNPEYFVPPDVVEDLEGAARRQLEDLVGSVRGRVPKAEGVVTRGTPWRAIFDLAKARGADLLVLSTSGRRGLQRVLIGSVAEKIVRLATIPVLTVGPKRGARAG